MIEILKYKMRPQEILAADVGIEREGLRVTKNGKLSTRPHPNIFGNKLKNPYITIDFSESQIELITPVFNSVKKSYGVLEALTNIIITEIDEKDELFWPQSMPCDIPEDLDVPIGIYEGEEGALARYYREELMKKYGGKRQLISGIHYNFSFSETLIKTLWNESKCKKEYKDFKDAIYLKVARNYLKFRWLIVYLMGSSPGAHASYIEECLSHMNNIGGNTYISEDVISIRNSSCGGYKNMIDIFPDYSSIDHFIKSINGFVENGDLSEVKELYAPIRLKAYQNKNILKSLKEDGIQYLEIRSLDLNIFDKCGISEIDLEFLNIFMVFLLLEGEELFETWQQEALINEKSVAEHGLNPELELLDQDHWTSKCAWAEDILEKINQIDDYLNLGQKKCIDVMMDRVKNIECTYAYRLKNLIIKKGYLEGSLELAEKYKKESKINHYQLKGFEEWELSSQILIKEALTRGIKLKIMDAHENIIALEKENHIEYIKQATKTSVDTYITPLLMENKVVTKMILNDAGITTPNSEEIFKDKNVLEILTKYCGEKVVIKPKSTNCGLGISIFQKGGLTQELVRAAKRAFKYDTTILVETYISGPEYRFLVIGNQVVAILHRRPANVCGDGIMSIVELVDIKNQHPYRGNGKTSPLKKIEMDEYVQMYLEEQGLSFQSIPKEGEIVFLRENSNISTGGDSIDYTDKMHSYFSEIALSAAKTMKAKFCGVDIIIDDYKNPESLYSVIELNFNPMIAMHAYPFEGKERRLGYNILKMIGF